MLTLQNIKDWYYYELARGYIERSSFEEYLHSNYARVYDTELNFLGYEAI